MGKVSFVRHPTLPDAVTLHLQERKVPLPNRMHFVNLYRQAAHTLFVGRSLSVKVRTANTIGQGQMHSTRRMLLINRANQNPLGVTHAKEGAHDARIFES